MSPAPEPHERGNLGKPPSQIQLNALRRFVRSADKDNREVDAEIKILTRLRQNRERIAKACLMTENVREGKDSGDLIGRH